MRRSIIVTLTAIAFTALGARTATAEITSPTEGAVVSGVVRIDEARGAVRDSFCTAVGASASSMITVTRLHDNVVVHQATNPGPGAWHTDWDSRDEPADGDFRIRSIAQDRTISSFCFNSSKTLSSIVVHLKNHRTYTDDGGLGTIAINPYLQRIRIRTTDGYDSGSRHDPTMRFVGLPAPATPTICDPSTDPIACVPSTPAIAAWCTDPTAPTFLPRLLLEGPQGCLPGTVPSPPGPPNPPPPPPIDPQDPPELPEPDPSLACATPAGCSGQFIVITYAADDLIITGIFDATTPTFVAVALRPDGPSLYPMRHLPS